MFCGFASYVIQYKLVFVLIILLAFFNLFLFTQRHVIYVSTWSCLYNSPLISVWCMVEFPHTHKHSHQWTESNCPKICRINQLKGRQKYLSYFNFSQGGKLQVKAGVALLMLFYKPRKMQCSDKSCTLWTIIIKRNKQKNRNVFSLAKNLGATLQNIFILIFKGKYCTL